MIRPVQYNQLLGDPVESGGSYEQPVYAAPLPSPTYPTATTPSYRDPVPSTTAPTAVDTSPSYPAPTYLTPTSPTSSGGGSTGGGTVTVTQDRPRPGMPSSSGVGGAFDPGSPSLSLGSTGAAMDALPGLGWLSDLKDTFRGYGLALLIGVGLVLILIRAS